MSNHGFGWMAVAAVLLGLSSGRLLGDGEGTEGTDTFPPRAEVIGKLASLPANHGILLGEATVGGNFNETAKLYELDATGPRARDYSIKMCWAPDRGRALFCGANHGVPHRLNDVWEFDLTSLTWVMLYAPDLSRGYADLGEDVSDVAFADGTLVTDRGGPAVIAHTWWGLSYDPDNRELLFMNTWVTDREKAVLALGGDPAELYPGPPLWAFDPADRTWRATKAPPPFPRPIFGGMLEFVPQLGGTVWHANNWQSRATWLYHAESNSWRDLRANGTAGDFETGAPEPEQIAYHDPQRALLIAHRHYRTHHYDPEQNRWLTVATGNEGDGLTPYGHDARSVIYYDPVSGDGLLLEFETNALWAYAPGGRSWTKLHPRGDPMPGGNKRLAYLDPDSNVFVVIDRTAVWAYRYQTSP